MLVERNENKKPVCAPPTKPGPSPAAAAKSLKENLLEVNTRDLLLQASSAPHCDALPVSTDLVTAETNKIAADYLKKILANELAKSPDNFRADFLANHRFGWEIRARMVS